MKIQHCKVAKLSFVDLDIVAMFFRSCNEKVADILLLDNDNMRPPDDKTMVSSDGGERASFAS